MPENDKCVDALNKIKHLSNLAVKKYEELMKLELETQDPLDIRFITIEKEIGLIKEVEEDYYQELFSDPASVSFLEQKYGSVLDIKVEYLNELFSNHDLAETRMTKRIQNYFIKNKPVYHILKCNSKAYSLMMKTMLDLLEQGMDNTNYKNEILYTKYMSFCVDPILENERLGIQEEDTDSLLEDAEKIDQYLERVFIKLLESFLKIEDQEYMQEEELFFLHLIITRIRALAKWQTSLKLDTLKRTILYMNEENCDCSYEIVKSLFNFVFNEDRKVRQKRLPKI